MPGPDVEIAPIAPLQGPELGPVELADLPEPVRAAAGRAWCCGPTARCVPVRAAAATSPGRRRTTRDRATARSKSRNHDGRDGPPDRSGRAATARAAAGRSRRSTNARAPAGRAPLRVAASHARRADSRRAAGRATTAARRSARSTAPSQHRSARPPPRSARRDAATSAPSSCLAFRLTRPSLPRTAPGTTSNARQSAMPWDPGPICRPAGQRSPEVAILPGVASKRHRQKNAGANRDRRSWPQRGGYSVRRMASTDWRKATRTMLTPTMATIITATAR